MQLRLKHVLLYTLAGQMAVLTGVMLLLYVVAALFVWWLQDPKMLGVAGAMAGICYGAAIIALLGEGVFAGRKQAILGLFWSMIIRTGIPLTAVMMMKVLGGPFVEPWAICYLLVFYFGALIVQVVLSYCVTNEVEPEAAARRPMD